MAPCIEFSAGKFLSDFLFKNIFYHLFITWKNSINPSVLFPLSYEQRRATWTHLRDFGQVELLRVHLR